MDGEQLELLFGAAAIAAYGVLLLVIPPDRLPMPFRPKPENRLMWGVLPILFGVGMAIYTVLGGR